MDIVALFMCCLWEAFYPVLASMLRSINRQLRFEKKHSNINTTEDCETCAGWILRNHCCSYSYVDRQIRTVTYFWTRCNIWRLYGWYGQCWLRYAYLLVGNNVNVTHVYIIEYCLVIWRSIPRKHCIVPNLSYR